MKSSLRNMVFILFVITVVCSAAVAVVNKMTQEPIAAAKQQKALEALEQVLPEFDAIVDTVSVDGCDIYPVAMAGERVGYAVSTTSANGFSGNIKLMVGFLEDGTIYNVAVLEQAETPGLGAKMVEEDNPLRMSFKGKNAGEVDMRVKKDGGDVDAITAATISSRAYAEAVEFAYGAFQKRDVVEDKEVVNLPTTMEVDGHTVGLLREGKKIVGYTIETSADAFNREVPVRLRVSFDTKATIVDVEVLEQRETPSLGGKMCDEGNVLLMSVKGKDASKLNFALRSGGGDIDAITAATISSRAYANAVKEAYEIYTKINR